MQKRTFNLENIILGFAVLMLLMWVLFPIILIFIQSFAEQEHISLDAYWKVIWKNKIFFLNTLKLGLAVVLGCIIIGAPLAWLIVRTDLPFRKFFRLLVLVTFLIPPFIATIAWEQLLNERNGYVTRIIESIPTNKLEQATKQLASEPNNSEYKLIGLLS